MKNRKKCVICIHFRLKLCFFSIYLSIYLISLHWAMIGLSKILFSILQPFTYGKRQSHQCWPKLAKSICHCHIDDYYHSVIITLEASLSSSSSLMMIKRWRAFESRWRLFAFGPSVGRRAPDFNSLGIIIFVIIFVITFAIVIVINITVTIYYCVEQSRWQK